MRGKGRVAGRIAVVIATVAALLAPGYAAPARTISIPLTVARTVTTTGARGTIPLAIAPTHVAFSWRGDEGTGVRFRTVDDTGVPTPWMRAPENHDAERGDRHFSGVLAVDRPVGIEWRSIEPRGADMGRITIDYLNTLDGPRALQTIPAVAEAGVNDPDIVTRAEWGADESIKRTSGSCRREFFPVQQLFVHHTAGSNFDTQPAATMRAIYWYHTVRQGWCDVGYNFVISYDGRVFEGRWARPYKPWELHSSENSAREAVVGAHVSGYNSGSVGISLMGNFTSVKPSPAARRALAELLAWEVDRHDLKPLGRHRYRNPETGLTKRLYFIAGHRDAGSTACPGSRLYRTLDVIRRDAKAAMGEGKVTTALSLEASAAHVDYGETVTFDGRLTADGSLTGPAGESITIYRRIGSGPWRVDSVVPTGVDGSFTFTIAPKKNLRVVAVYHGDASNWGSESRGVRVRVRPLVSLVPEGGMQDAAGTYHYPAGTTSVDLAGGVTPNRAGSTVTIKIFEELADGTSALLVEPRVRLDADSRYRYSFAIPSGTSGSYSALTRFSPDSDHAFARSEMVRFRLDQ